MLDYFKLFKNHFKKNGEIKKNSCLHTYFLALISETRIYEYEGDYYHGHYKAYFNYHFRNFSDFLKKLDIKYTIAHDDRIAPRGGKCGNYLKIVDNEKARKIYDDFLRTVLKL